MPLKIHLFLIIACLAIFFVIYPAEAIPWTSEENKSLDADAIAVGRIMSYSDEGAHRYYEISIIKWIKNPQQDQTITMRSIAPEVFNPHFPYAIFAKKDLGLFYLKLVDGEWRSTNYSKQIWASELSQTIYDMKKLVGNNNPDSSVSLERICKEGYVNAIKNRTGEIACVKPHTLQKLRERGWAEQIGGIVFQKPSQNITNENPILADNQILTVVGDAPCAWMGLHQIPHNELLNRHDRTGVNALLLKIDDDDINKVSHLKEMFVALENKTGFQQNEYEKNAWAKRINSTETEQQKIWNWLKDTFDSQYGKRSDDSFTSYFTYKEKFYHITWALC